MKKLVSLLVALTTLVACFATSAFAANSPVGNVTVKDVAGIEVEGLTEAESDKIADEFKLEVSTEAWVDPIKTAAGITEKLGEADYKLFQGAKLVLSDEGEALLGDKTVKTATVTLNVPGVTEANAPKVVSYDPATKAYTVVTTTVVGSNVSATVPVAADGVAYVAVIYTGAATSPETNVAAWAIGVVAMVALAGAVYAGKKVFAA